MSATSTRCETTATEKAQSKAPAGWVWGGWALGSGEAFQHGPGLLPAPPRTARTTWAQGRLLFFTVPALPPDAPLKPMSHQCQDLLFCNNGLASALTTVC